MWDPDSEETDSEIVPKKYGVDNLWKYDLPKGWRLLYSVRGNEIIVISIILEWHFLGFFIFSFALKFVQQFY